MNRTTRNWVTRPSLVILLAVSVAGQWGGLTAQSAALKPAEISARLASYIDPYLAQKDFSGVMMAVQGDTLLVHEAYGFADARTKTVNTRATKFRAASLSKAFTAGAIVMLMEKGRLTLTDPLSKFFPRFPNGQQITIEQLLRHTSGVGELDEPRHYRRCFSGAELVEQIGRVKPLFSPGTDDGYSNEGYSLLAAVIETVSGESYDGFLRKHIFEPLHMADSGSSCTTAGIKGLATGYVAGPRAATTEQVAFSELTQMGAGSVYSTAPDLVTWLKAVNGNRLFRLNSLAYPYGWGRREYSGHTLIEQSGLVEGFNAYMALYPQEQLYIVFLSNIQSGLFNRVPKDLQAVAFGGEWSRPRQLPAMTLPSAAIEEYVGDYKAADTPLPLHVIKKDRELYLRWGHYPFMRSMTPLSKDRFFHRAEYVDVTFERGKDGRIETMRWQAGEGEPQSYLKVKD